MMKRLLIILSFVIGLAICDQSAFAASCASSAVAGNWTCPQSKSAGSGASSVANEAVVLGSNTTTGNTIVIGQSWGNNTSTCSTPTISTGAATFIAAQSNIQVPAQAQRTCLWYAVNITGGTTPTVTCKINVASTFHDCDVHEYNNSGGAATFDVTSGLGATCTAGVCNGTPITTTAANDLVVEMIFPFGGPMTATAGWNLRETTGGGSYDQQKAIAGSVTPTGNDTTGSDTASVMVVSFKPPAGGAAAAGFNKRQKLEKLDPV